MARNSSTLSGFLIDFHVGYEFDTGNPLLGQDEVYIDIKNAFDRRPPFNNLANG